MFVRGKEMFEYLAKKNFESTSIYRKQICLQDSPFFGRDGFDFTEIIENENWTPERINREHKGYMMRIMRKCTGLYQHMEDTLFKLYPIEYKMEDPGPDFLEIRRLKFFKAFINGLVNSDEKGIKWTTIIDESGDTETIIKFSRMVLLKLDDFERKLLADGLSLYLVYDKYREIRCEFELSDHKLDVIQKKVFEKLSDEEANEMINERTAVLQSELKTYYNKYGDKNDPTKAMMDAYELKEYLMDDIQLVVDFYKTLEDMLEEKDDFFF